MMNFTIGRYIPNDTWFHQLDPRFKIMALLFLLIAIFFPAGFIGYGVMFVAIFIALKISHLIEMGYNLRGIECNSRFLR